jgi:hypothetical protein
MKDNDKGILNVNMIIGNSVYRKGETIDRSIIPEQLRNRKYYSRIDAEDSPPTPNRQSLERLKKANK